MSWIRTSITMAGLGFVVAKFGILLREVGGSHVHPLTSKAGAVVGVGLVFAGMAMAGLATLRFAQTRRDIDAGVVRFSPTLDIALALLFGIASVVLAIYIIGTA